MRERLRLLHELAGAPPADRLAELAVLAGHLVDRSAVAAVTGDGSFVPEWGTVAAFVDACVAHARAQGRPLPSGEGDLAVWRARYEQATREGVVVVRNEAVAGPGTVVQVGVVKGDLYVEQASAPGSAQELPVRLVTELSDPFELEVHQAVEAGHCHTASLPTYVVRAHDVALREVVDAVLGGANRFVVLVGESSTGKTRALWELLSALPPGWVLWQPIFPDHGQALLDGADLVRPNTVVWLNDLQNFLAGSDGEQVAAAVRALVRQRQPRGVLVVGTLWPSHWHEYTRSPGEGELDERRQARALLTGRAVLVPRSFSEPRDQQALRLAAATDQRLAVAATRAEDGRVTQYLAGGPALLERYRTAPREAAALIDAAIDARRLGHAVPLPHALLEAAAEGSLPDADWNRLATDWSDRAFAFAREPVLAAEAPLTLLRPGRARAAWAGPHYQLSDFLDQHGRSTDRQVPGAVWEALVRHASSSEFLGLMHTAWRRGHYRIALALCASACRAGVKGAVREGGEMLDRLGRRDDAIAWLGRAAMDGDAKAATRLATLLVQGGRLAEALEVCLRAEFSAVPELQALAGSLLVRLERADESTVPLRSAALRAWSSPYARGAVNALDLATGVAGHNPDQVRQWWQVAASHTSDHFTLGLEDAAREALTAAIGLLDAGGRGAEADVLLMRAADEGSVDALDRAVQRLLSQGRAEEVIAWLTHAVESTQALDAWNEVLRQPDALSRFGAANVVELGVRSSSDGRLEPGGTFHRTAVVVRLRWVVKLLTEAGREGEALAWVRALAMAGHTHAWRKAATLLTGADRAREAVEWFAGVGAPDDSVVTRLTALLLWVDGRKHEAVRTYQRVVAATGRSDDFMWLARLLDGAGRAEEALVCWQRAVEAGDLDPDDPDPLDYIERIIGDLRAAGAGDSAAVRSSLRWLQDLSCTDGDSSVEAFLKVQQLLGSGGDRAEYLDWLERFASGPHGSWSNDTFLRETARSGRADAILRWSESSAPDGTAHALTLLRALLPSGEVESVVLGLAASGGVVSATTLAAAGLGERALALARRDGAARRPGLPLFIAELEAAMGRPDEAFDWMQRSIGMDLNVLPRAAELLSAAGHGGEAALLRRHGWEPDGTISQPWGAPLPHDG